MLATVHGVELHYEESGNGPTIVFIHDTPDNRNIFTRHLQILAESGFRTVCTNLRGAGGAGDDLVALLNYLGIGRAVIIGMAGGGAALLDLLEQHPARVAAASFVLSRAQAKTLGQRVSQHDLRQLLRQGVGRDLQQALRQVLPREQTVCMPAERDFGAIRGWIERVRRHCRAGVNNCSALLGKLDLPPLLLAAEEPPDEDEILSDLA